MKMLGGVLIAAICLSAGPVLAGKKKEEAAPAAGGPACAANYKQDGNYIAGRRFSTWEVVPGVSPSVAFKRIYMEGVKSGLKVTSSDEKMGIIQFEQVNAGKSFTSEEMVNLPWSITVEAEGKGSKISITKTTPPAYSTGKDAQIKSMCMVVDAARGTK
jgi:hypothetical protein